MEFKQVLALRRSNYDLSTKSTLTAEQLKTLLGTALNEAPTGFNSQSSRIVLAQGAKHNQVWDFVLEGIKAAIGEGPAFEKSKEKIAAFRNTAGTILFFEEYAIVRKLEQDYALYKHNFEPWARESQGMLQYAVWTLLAEAGMGASLQHYNELIEARIIKEWKLPTTWKLIAQMPFGVAQSQPKPRDKAPLDTRLFVK